MMMMMMMMMIMQIQEIHVHVCQWTMEKASQVQNDVKLRSDVFFDHDTTMNRRRKRLFELSRSPGRLTRYM